MTFSPCSSHEAFAKGARTTATVTDVEMATIQQIIPDSDLVPPDKEVTTELCKQVMDKWPEGQNKRLTADRLKPILTQIQAIKRKLAGSPLLAIVYTRAAMEPEGIHAQLVREQGGEIPQSYMVYRAQSEKSQANSEPQ